MKEFVPVLKRTKLFSGVGEEDICTMLSCLGARLSDIKKVNMYCVRESILMIFLFLQKAACIFKEMISGATAVFWDISESERYSEKHMWLRKAGRF